MMVSSGKRSRKHQPITSDTPATTRSQGALIVSETTTGPASSAGLRVGDVIVQLDNTPVTNVQSLGDALLSKSPSDTMAVKIYRGSQQMTVNEVCMGWLALICSACESSSGITQSAPPYRA
ncbi:MAG: PDZ domain-containing protein [Chloroflexi bacterium]|nr:MAG: PDZ domain-containing protein [Chloroflexota bacterium]